MSSPLIIAHRGGNQNWPENTLCAFQHDVTIGVDAIELDVQVTKDGVVVVYHPDDLSKWTMASGPVAGKTVAQVTALDTTSKYQGSKDFQKSCTAADLKIPKLADVFEKIPFRVPLIIDMKSLPAQLLVDALVAQIPQKEWPRLTFYSTNKNHTDLLKKKKPTAVVFEDREQTLKRLMTQIASHQCSVKGEAPWIGFEMKRALDVCDKTKLGDTCVNPEFVLWNPSTVQCTRQQTSAKIVFFGVNTAEDYRQARELGANAVYSDNPAFIVQQRQR